MVPRLREIHMPCAHRDLTGQTFGYYTALHYATNAPRSSWVCRCTCGNERTVITYGLVNGKATNCGCKRKVDRTGERFGMLIVTGRTTKDGIAYWTCDCDCGATAKLVRQSDLYKVVSCGCAKNRLKSQAVLPNETYGKWLVLARDESVSGTPMYRCRCVCGAEHTVLGKTLLNGTSRSCRSCATTGDLIGKRFSNLTVLARAGSSADGAAMWSCACKCGAAITVPTYKLTRGTTRSCGCKDKFKPRQAAYFYHILTDAGFSGFGITWRPRERIQQHVTNLKRAGIRTKRIQIATFRGRKAALAFERSVKYNMRSHIVDTFVPGFQTEAIRTKHNSKLYSMLSDAGRKLTPFSL